ncbi:hypothetical protein [Sulfuricurvum sp. RIFCSPLOWO2_12_FULL_43_24]|uniref:hypothetical protein n=1 Tax=Sulfuricurvum sp. RIFCSPLOWO2_12_FULL_43_24 TaxID=1802247 RepID=UPI0025D4CF8E|nr:hypothetical protein [Sulfuricurvum sp. RIFCSPLOWO2_12_FULL_43_24]
MENEVISIIKFGAKRYIQDLYENGTVFMQRLYNYPKIEHPEIGDKNEGISHLFQAEQTKMSINGRDIEPIGGIKILESNAYNPFIYCTYALREQHFENGVNCIDRRCLDLGDSAFIFKDFDKFYSLLKNAIAEEDNIYMDLVTYADETTYNGEMGIFKKLSSYQHQSEHRIVLESSCKSQNIQFGLGSLKEMSYVVDTQKLLDTLKKNGNNLN